MADYYPTTRGGAVRYFGENSTVPATPEELKAAEIYWATTQPPDVPDDGNDLPNYNEWETPEFYAVITYLLLTLYAKIAK